MAQSICWWIFFILLYVPGFSRNASLISSVVYNEITVKHSEVNGLLKWKASFDNHSQALLSSWTGTDPCKWEGILCDKSKFVSSINLANYGLQGTLHTLNFSLFPNLLSLNIHNNSFYGTLPPQIINMSKLNHLNLSLNSFGGYIPKELWTLSSLRSLDISLCHLSGAIPNSIANLANLSVLNLGSNNLSGYIPLEIGKLKSLESVDIGYNHFFGSIPHEIGMLTNLKDIDLSHNTFSGNIPSTIGNLVNLNVLELYNNHLYGSIPVTIGNLTKLTGLGLDLNDFSGSIPASIGNLINLDSLTLEGNRLSGSIPPTMGHLTLITMLGLSSNKLNASIPREMNNITNLYILQLSDNDFTGYLPHQICSGGSLAYFAADHNHLIGRLHLSSNHLSGNLPKELGNLKSLVEVKINNNHFSGNIPTEIGLIRNLQHLDLARNEFSGTIPNQVVGLPNLLELNLSNNNIKGSIPSGFSQLQPLESLDLNGNHLSGTIPRIVGELRRLQLLNLSHNNLSGTIPSSFDEMSSLISVDISYNQLEGPLPKNQAFLKSPIDSLRNNKGLCGNVTGLALCPINHSPKSVKVMLLTEKEEETQIEQQNGELFSIWSYDGKIIYENIIEATENFDDKYLIAVGGQGCVYKVELPTGMVVAVKKLHSITNEETSTFKAFTSEVQALTELKHRNIVKLYGFCSHSQFSFLVYEFLEGGSLDQILNNETQAMAFDWKRRVNVVKGLANALSYMHHDCSPPIIHRDISSKNVLLDLEYEAHLSDFGTAKFLRPDSCSWTPLVGTFGYIAPDLLDERLPQPMNSIVGEIIMIARLAFTCLSEHPHSRPTMDQVSKELLIGKSPLANWFPMIKLEQLL
ncbi:Tyrosine-protein kinase, active site [Sesbania bispinosa]|nr:Tyrosine-protein kinase, active site [Sesbania bispinosa]